MEIKKAFMFIKYSNKKFIILVLCLLTSNKVFGGIYSDYILFGCFAYTFAFLILKKIRINKSILPLSIIVLLWCLLILWKYNSNSIFSNLGLIVRVYYAFFVLCILKKEFIPYFLKGSYTLSILSLPFYFLGVAFPQIYHVIYDLFGNSKTIFATDRLDGLNFFIYTFDLNNLHRNSGFMWEPGAFAGILLMTLVLQLIITDFKINKKVILIVLCVVTTFSAMAFLGLYLILIFLLCKANLKYKIVYGFLGLFLVFYGLNSSFIFDKIQKQYEKNFVTMEIEESVPIPDRILSFRYDLEQFKRHPLIGTGLNSSNRFQNFSIYSGSSVGFSDYMVKFGIYGIFFLLFNLLNTLKKINKEQYNVLNILIPIVFIFISVSEVFIDLPISWCFQIYYLKD